MALATRRVGVPLRAPRAATQAVTPFAVTIPPELLDAVAQRAADLVVERLRSTRTESPYLSVAEAADYLRAKPQRIYDLLSSRRLTRFKDGSRVLLLREELDSYVGEVARGRVAPPLPSGSQSRSGSALAA
jgi:excisionase family DNA binding protein